MRGVGCPPGIPGVAFRRPRGQVPRERADRLLAVTLAVTLDGPRRA